VAVPGNPAGVCELADHGIAPLGDVRRPAPSWPATRHDHSTADVRRASPPDAEAVRTYLHGGRTPAVGAPLAQPNLAASFRRIGREGIQAVYGGPFGDAIVAALGGVMTRRDLEAYPERLGWDDPIATTYRDVEVFAPAPPSSGSQVIQTLNGMAGWNVGSFEHLGPDHLAVIAEAARAARLDTHRHIGDPDVVAVPIERLLSPARTEALRAEMRARLDAPRRPVAVAGGSDASGGASTTHLAAMDSSGLAVNVTQSLGNGFGSGIVVPGTGICLNNALHWTSTDPGHPNVVQPGKRHEWPVAPVQLFRGGKLWGTVGTPGSYGILVTTVQVLANLIDFGLNVQDAIGAPRFRWLDEAIDPLPADRLRIESRVPEATRRALAARGYGLEVMGPWSMRVGGVQAIIRDQATGWLMGGADPRRNGYAMGW
jgi:gamma-glutamyltranspeptidase/glutathione hydrolase